MSYRRVKERLWHRDPHCHWCGVKTLLITRPEWKGEEPDNLATVDHLRSRYNPLRWAPNHSKETRRVLSCWKCNQHRDRQETKSLPLEEILARSHGWSLRKKVLTPAV